MHFGGGQKFLQRDFKEFARGDAHLARQPPMFQRFGKASFYNGILRRAEVFTTGFEKNCRKIKKVRFFDKTGRRQNRPFSRAEDQIRCKFHQNPL